MVQFTHLSLTFLSFLYLTAPIHATYNSFTTRRGIKWVEPNRHALVLLSTPDLPIWNLAEHIGENIPSNLILDITLSPDNRTLLVQGQPFLPLPDPDRPAQLSAPQSSISVEEFENKRLPPDLRNTAYVALDYERTVRPQDDQSVTQTPYSTEITLDLLGAGIENHNSLLPSRSQWIVKIRLESYGGGEHKSAKGEIPHQTFSINDIWLQQRDEHYKFPSGEASRECTLRSWRCGDIAAAPWYRYVFRHDFDEWGRVGSLRHEVMKRWDTLCRNLGPVLLLAVLAAVFGGLGYTIYLLMAQRREMLARGGEGVDYVVVEDGDAAAVDDESDRDSENDEEKGVYEEKQGESGQDAGSHDGEEAARTILAQPRSRYHRYRS